MSKNYEDASPNQPPKDPNTFSQEFQHAQVSARVPEKIGRGVFSTGVLVQQGNHEFVLDFVQGMVQPRQIAARVVVPPTFVPGFLAALRENLASYQNQFGPPPALRQPPPPAAPPPVEDIYAQFKLPDEMLGGVYANSARIVHTQSEFCLDFIAGFYPKAVVACRVYLTVPQIPVLVNALAQSLQQFQQRRTQQPGEPPEPPVN
jgi:hypothetical protein